MQQTITFTARERATLDAVLNARTAGQGPAVRRAVYGGFLDALIAADRAGNGGELVPAGDAVRWGWTSEVTLPDDVWDSIVAEVRAEHGNEATIFDRNVLNALDDKITDGRIRSQASELVRRLREVLFAPTTVVSEKLQLIDKARLVLGDHGASEASYALRITQTAHDLEAAMRDVEQAAEGDSNDAEIEAWQTVGQHAALLTGLLLAGPAEDAFHQG